MTHEQTFWRREHMQTWQDYFKGKFLIFLLKAWCRDSLWLDSYVAYWPQGNATRRQKIWEENVQRSTELMFRISAFLMTPETLQLLP